MLRIESSESLVDATERAIQAARHLTVMDAGALEALRRVAAVIDCADQRDALGTDDRSSRPKGLGGSDNIYVTYLKFCTDLGLTPAGRSKLGDLTAPATGGKLAQLRAITGGRTGPGA